MQAGLYRGGGSKVSSLASNRQQLSALPAPVRQRVGSSSTLNAHRAVLARALLVDALSHSDVLKATATTLATSGSLAAAAHHAISPLRHIVLYSVWMLVVSTCAATGLHIASHLWKEIEGKALRGKQKLEEVETLHGVDINVSYFLSLPTVQRAANFAAEAHRGQVRKNGDPVVTHAIHTALVVEGALKDSKEKEDRVETAIICALLHDVMDDAGVTVEEVREGFGDAVADMVQKVSQLSQMNQLMRRRIRQLPAEHAEEDINTLRSLILSMVHEPLVLVVKLADRLHNMRTAYALRPDKRRSVAVETLRVWCSLAEKIGMFAIKAELEDLCFAVLQPSEFAALRAELDTFWDLPEASSSSQAAQAAPQEEEDVRSVPHYPLSRRLVLNVDWQAEEQREEDERRTAEQARRRAATAPRDPDAWMTDEQRHMRSLAARVVPFDATLFKSLCSVSPAARSGIAALEACARELVKELQMEASVTLDIQFEGRLKSLWSMHRKMARKGVSLRGIYDARALRVVVDDEGGAKSHEAAQACYSLVPTIHRLWRPIRGECDDYIANPKKSGYQSLHTAVVGPQGVPLEVQIRTRSMHDEAEFGGAAHWDYKESAPAPPEGHVKPVGKVGQPVLRVHTSGDLRQGVVVATENNGLRLLVAISGYTLPTPRPGEPHTLIPYRRLQDYVKGHGWFAAGHGDLNACLETFTLCVDGCYHRLDSFGHKHPTTVVPIDAWHSLKDMEFSEEEDFADASKPDLTFTPPPPGPFGFGRNAPAFAAEPVPVFHDRALSRSGSGGMAAVVAPRKAKTVSSKMNQVEAQMAAVLNEEKERTRKKVRQLRGILEWGREMAEPVMQAETVQDVMVLIWPSGKIERLPRGTTAGHIIATQGLIQIEEGKAVRRGLSSKLVNVNNRLVPEETPLDDGDLVVLSRDILEI